MAPRIDPKIISKNFKKNIWDIFSKALLQTYIITCTFFLTVTLRLLGFGLQGHPGHAYLKVTVIPFRDAATLKPLIFPYKLAPEAPR